VYFLKQKRIKHSAQIECKNVLILMIVLLPIEVLYNMKPECSMMSFHWKLLNMVTQQEGKQQSNKKATTNV